MCTTREYIDTWVRGGNVPKKKEIRPMTRKERQRAKERLEVNKGE